MTRARHKAFACLLATLLAGCAGTPAPIKQAPAAPVVAPAGKAAPRGTAPGDVLGRSERFVIYAPTGADTLPSIAARFLGDAGLDWRIAEFNGVARPEPGKPLVVPLSAVNARGVWHDEVQTVPILCYHRFGPGGGKMTVSPANFEAQLAWLAKEGYRVIALADLAGYLEGKRQLPRRSVVITIDDGYESVHRHAWPLLKRYGFPATLFIYPDFIGAGDAMSWKQLEELAASKLIDVQPHSKTHRNLIDRLPGETDERYRKEVESEVREPRAILERRLPVRVSHYAYPYGDANETVHEILAAQRYTLAVTVNPGGNAFYAEPFMLRRTMIYGDHDLQAFKARLQTAQPLATTAPRP